MSLMKMAKSVAMNAELLTKFRSNFISDPKNILAQNACSKYDPNEICFTRSKLHGAHHVFTHKVESEGKPMTDQKTTGRCWLFAALNAIRIPFMKQYKLEEFEFSQAYLFFHDKIEKSNFFLNNIVETARRGEPVDGRLVSFLLHEPINDGGQWHMFVSLVNKYGLMPKKVFPESFSSESSARMNSILKSKLREYAKVLRTMIDEGKTDGELSNEIEAQMETIYRIVAICLGVPEEKFVWEYYDKTKAYSCVGPVTPLEFYEKHVKPYFNVDDKVCLVNDPRPSNPYGRLYTVDCLGNVVNGVTIAYNNQPVELLARLTAESIKANEPVWFGCEVLKRMAVKHGIEDLTIHDYTLVFGVDINLGLTKAERLLYGESMMTHAMVFTGVSLQDNEVEGKPLKWRVENSWGEERGEKGYLVMTQDWFREYVFEVVIDKKYVPKEVLDVFNEMPTVLPAWDPMGTLAE